MTQENNDRTAARAQFGGPAQGDGEPQGKGSGHRGDQGEQSSDTSRLEREGHEFPRTGEAGSTNMQNTGQAGSMDEGVGEARTGSVDPELERGQRAASTGTTSGGDSWRPSADPAAGDMATGTDQDDTSKQQGSDDNR